MTLKKLTAYLLVFIMVIGLWPNTYEAASFNHVNKVLTVMNEEILIGNEAPILSMTLIDNIEEGAIFYIELSGAKWLDLTYEGRIKGYSGNGFLEVKPVNHQKLQIKVKGEAIESGNVLQIPMQLQMTGDTAIATIKGNNTVISSGSYVVAKATSYKGSISVGEVPTTTQSGMMADIVILEPFSKAFSKAVAKGESNVIELRLNHNAYAFSLMDSQVSLKPLEGFEDIALDGFHIKQIDPQTLEVTLPDTSSANYTGAFKLSGLYIQLIDKASPMDTLTVTVVGDLMETTIVDVLKVMDYEIVLKGTSQTARAGSMQTVKFSLEEQVEESLIRNRPTYFTFTDGVAFNTVQDKVAVSINGEVGYYPTVVEKGEVVGFEISRLPQDITCYDFEVEAIVMPEALGNIKVIAEGRSLVETLSLSVLEVYQPFQVDIQAFDVVVGLKDQVGGAVILKETKAGEFIQGEKIVLDLEESNIKYSGLPEVLITSGDLRLGQAMIVGGQIEIPVIRSSHEASTIVIRNFKVTVDQTIATGHYHLKVGGKAFSTLATEEKLMPVAQGTLIRVNEMINEAPDKSEDEDKQEVDKPLVQVVFTIGQMTYQSGEKEKMMDVAPYTRNGRTMMPIKYVAEALGISAANIHWNNTTKTVTIYADQKVTLQLGSLEMTINGEKVMMSAAPEAIQGRIFVPVAEISRALNVTTNWDNIKKQVTFTV